MQEAINVAAKDWGLECLRYEISEYFFLCFDSFGGFSCLAISKYMCCCIPGDIMPPNGVRVAMEMQAEAERKKRAQILESEGKLADLCSVIEQCAFATAQEYRIKACLACF